MKNSLLAFALALMVVVGGTSLRKGVAGIGTSPIPLPPKPASEQALNVFGIGTSPIPLPPKPANEQEVSAFGIGTSPIPLPPKPASSR